MLWLGENEGHTMKIILCGILIGLLALSASADDSSTVSINTQTDAYMNKQNPNTNYEGGLGFTPIRVKNVTRGEPPKSWMVQ